MSIQKPSGNELDIWLINFSSLIIESIPRLKMNAMALGTKARETVIQIKNCFQIY